MTKFDYVIEKPGEKIFTYNDRNIEAIIKTFGPYENEIGELFIGPADAERVFAEIFNKGIALEVRYNTEQFRSGQQALYGFVKGDHPALLSNQRVREFRITDHTIAETFVNSLGLYLSDALHRAKGKKVNAYQSLEYLYAIGINR
jgi:hypothetical protein